MKNLIIETVCGIIVLTIVSAMAGLYAYQIVKDAAYDATQITHTIYRSL